MPYWNISHGTAVVLGHRQDVTEVSPWMYGLSSVGADRHAVPHPARPRRWRRRSRRLRAAGKLIVPSIANITGGKWSYAAGGPDAALTAA